MTRMTGAPPSHGQLMAVALILDALVVFGVVFTWLVIRATRCANPDCGHDVVFHDLARDRRTRKACTIHAGPKAEPCGCPAYEPEEVSA